MFGLCIELYGRVNLRLNHRAAIDFIDSLAALGIAQASLALRSVCAAIEYGWLHLSIARASSALRSVCAAILHSSFFTLHFFKIFQQLFSCECIVLPSLV